MASDFSPLPELAEVSQAYSLDCVDFMASKFQIKLDFSAGSVAAIEQCLEILHVQMADASPTQEQLDFFSKMFGSYLGETYRRNYGGVWGVGADRQPSLQTVGELVCFPWVRVHKRIVNGDEDNVQHWFDYLVKNGGTQAEPAPTPSAGPPPLPGSAGQSPTGQAPSKPKGFLSRLFGG
jgi:hypothetical protein